MFFSGWRAVALCAVTATLAIGLRVAPWHRTLLLCAWAVCTAHLAACPLVLLDIVGGLLPGMGVPFSPVACISRFSCLTQGILIGATAVVYRRRWRSHCLFCGRRDVAVQPANPPLWAWCAAYLAVAGCLTRLGAQLAIGFGPLVHHGPQTHVLIEALAFEAAFLLAGTVLPLSLVHRWGRIVPGFIPILGGHRVPRWLPLGPAFAIGALMTIYFGVTLAKLTTDTFTGTNLQSYSPFPLVFFWIAVPAYWIWGIGLTTAAVGYHRITRPKCPVCSL